MSVFGQSMLATVHDVAAVMLIVVTAKLKRWEKSSVFACRRNSLVLEMLIGGSVAGSGFFESPTAPISDEDALQWYDQSQVGLP
jgi:hypothetical protein